ncbi:DMT family transporter [Roseospira goensis]|uniref:Drug/metabolite transporter (DMT)-like permease n=1 Tax=Roseospira goensis TaxID=391922 RepID=A0A7W6S0N5_9PROT|nr:DMT family transporter [Roseospira goensis]MBB4286210.1 drug/metabolite transporter (DMT)-like permease [Roseospira goensis]
MDIRTIGAVSLTVLLWSSAFPGIRAGLAGYDPGHMVLLRFLLASIALAGLAAVTRMPLPRGRDLPAILGLGLLGIGVYQSGLTFGEQSVTAGAAALIVALMPLFMALLAVAALGEHLTALGWAGSLVSFGGVILVALGQGAAPDGGSSLTGVALVLGATLATSIFFVFQKPYLRRYSALQITACGIWAATAVMAVLWGPGLATAVRAAPLDATLAVVYLGVCPGMIAYVSWAYALSRAPASILGSVIYLQPPLAMVIALVWLGEVPAVESLAGGLIVLAGVLIVSRWGRRPAGVVARPV